MDYGKSKKQLNTLRDEYGEPMFRMGLTHLLDIGSHAFTEESVKMTCEKITAEEENGLMTKEFQCAIVKMAYEISKINATDILAFVSKEMYYAVSEGEDDGSENK